MKALLVKAPISPQVRILAEVLYPDHDTWSDCCIFPIEDLSKTSVRMLELQENATEIDAKQIEYEYYEGYGDNGKELFYDEYDDFWIFETKEEKLRQSSNMMSSDNRVYALVVEKKDE